MHDAVLCEAAGIPATVLVTEVFRDLAERTARNLGAPGYPIVFIEHPIWTRDPAWFPAVAARVEPQVVERLTAGRPAG